MDKKIVLTGLQPTGNPHIGNYVGAMRPMIDMVNNSEQSFAFVADLHALNSLKDKNAVKNNSYSIIAAYLALGINLDKTLLFRQSDILEVAAFSSLLMNVTPKGLMNKAHAYKAAMDKNKEAGKPQDDGINMGLYTYPILMAADILIYKSDLVPVGEDQRQHIEFTRDIAMSFNYIYGDVLKIPEGVLQETTKELPGLDGRKMSKSYNNTIPIFSTEKDLKKLIMKIKTDSKLPTDPKDPDDSQIVEYYRCFASEDEIKTVEQAFREGKIGYGDAKLELFRVINNYFKESREKYEYLMNNKNEIDEILEHGASVARKRAQETLREVKEVMIG